MNKEDRERARRLLKSRQFLQEHLQVIANRAEPECRDAQAPSTANRFRWLDYLPECLVQTLKYEALQKLVNLIQSKEELMDTMSVAGVSEMEQVLAIHYEIQGHDCDMRRLQSHREYLEKTELERVIDVLGTMTAYLGPESVDAARESAMRVIHEKMSEIDVALKSM